MGDSYTVLPLIADPGIPLWLEQHGIATPPIPATNRYPTLHELRAVLAQFGWLHSHVPYWAIGM